MSVSRNRTRREESGLWRIVELDLSCNALLADVLRAPRLDRLASDDAGGFGTFIEELVLLDHPAILSAAGSITSEKHPALARPAREVNHEITR